MTIQKTIIDPLTYEDAHMTLELARSTLIFNNFRECLGLAYDSCVTIDCVHSTVQSKPLNDHTRRTLIRLLAAGEIETALAITRVVGHVNDRLYINAVNSMTTDRHREAIRAYRAWKEYNGMTFDDALIWTLFLAAICLVSGFFAGAYDGPSRPVLTGIFVAAGIAIAIVWVRHRDAMRQVTLLYAKLMFALDKTS